MNIKRLKKLAHLMRWHWLIFPRVEFDISLWNKPKDNAGFCRTAACAVGSAMMYKPFQKMGLSSNGKLGTQELAPKYMEMTGWYAVAAFFGISYADAHYLFDSHEYPDGYETTAKQVAQRVKQYIKENK